MGGRPGGRFAIGNVMLMAAYLGVEWRYYRVLAKKHRMRNLFKIGHIKEGSGDTLGEGQRNTWGHTPQRA